MWRSTWIILITRLYRVQTDVANVILNVKLFFMILNKSISRADTLEVRGIQFIVFTLKIWILISLFLDLNMD